MADIGSLIIRIGADAGDLQRAFTQLEGSAKQFEKGLTTIGKVGAAAFLAMASGITALVVASGKQAEALDQLSQKTGISVRTFQEWSVIMAENTFQAESLTAGMRTLSKLVVEARDPASAAAAAFDEIGISITALGSTEQVIRSVSDRFKAMPDGVDKARIAVQLFGKAGLEMIPMLNQGSAAFDASKAAAQRFGAVLSTDQVSALKAADDATDRLGVALGALRTQFALTFASHVGASADNFANGVGRLTLALRAMGQASEDASKRDGVLSLDYIKSLFPMTAKLVELYARLATPPQITPPPIMQGDQEDAHVIQQKMQAGLEQENAGLRIRNQLIHEWVQFIAQGHAQESLGAFSRTKDLKAYKDAQDELTTAMSSAMEAGTEEALLIDTLTEAWKALSDQVKGMPSSMPKAERSRDTTSVSPGSSDMQRRLDIQNELGISVGRQMDQERQGLAIQAGLTNAYQQRFAVQEAGLTIADAVQRQQEQMYQSERGFLGASDAARRVAFDAQEQRYAMDRARLMELAELEPHLQAQTNAQLEALDIERETKRMAIIAQYPSFVEQQLAAVVASNAFSVGSIVNTWTSGIATMILKGGNLQAAWEATQQALLQAALNTLVQWGAQASLAYLKDQALQLLNLQTKATAEETARATSLMSHTGYEAAKTAITITGESTRLAAMLATNKAIAAAALLSLATVASVGNAVVAIMLVAMEAAAAMLSAAATALLEGVYTAPLAPAAAAAAASLAAAGPVMAVAAGAAIQAALGTAIVAGSVPALAAGGIVTRPTLALIGEAGPEAVIPLKGQQMNGGQMPSTIYTSVQIDGREIARASARHTGRAYRMEGAPA